MHCKEGFEYLLRRARVSNAVCVSGHNVDATSVEQWLVIILYGRNGTAQSD